MLTVRKSCDRGHADHGWLRSLHSFSFAGYRDARYMGFGNLRVLNEDRIAPGAGLGLHSHRDVEILSYVLSGVLACRDCGGRVQSIPAGHVQRICAGTGVTYAEFNQAPDQPAHYLQIWLEPGCRGAVPECAQVPGPALQEAGLLHLLAAPVAPPGALALHADARVYAGRFDGAAAAALALDPARKCYVHMVRGTLQANGRALSGGDAVFIEHETHLDLRHGQGAEVLVLDLAA
ncbi:pirin family protein [Acidovorax sp. GBBC 3334]|uniref:pirin family protein n=1 Tax=Acidovorax sp. GBBC 3334 TaxID=2940496 RepID=UPI002304197B|nr:pirin family protein [Acidovorax sp. GBBC 3334]MDA8453408.1 pirin family protein [Acidovorax sp. GBBC 3334]